MGNDAGFGSARAFCLRPGRTGGANLGPQHGLYTSRRDGDGEHDANLRGHAPHAHARTHRHHCANAAPGTHAASAACQYTAARRANPHRTALWRFGQVEHPEPGRRQDLQTLGTVPLPRLPGQ